MTDNLLTARQLAEKLNVSESFVRKHRVELGATYLGRSLRFPAYEKRYLALQSSAIGKPRKPESEFPMLRRYQRGCVIKKGGTWYGQWRADTVSPDGSLERRQIKVRLGTLVELPSKSAARDALRRVMPCSSKPKMQMTFRQLVERWEALVVPTFDKSSTASHYRNALRGVLPVFGEHDIAAITRYDAQVFVSNSASRYSRSTLRSFKTSMSVVFEWAILNGWIRENPCSKIKLPRAEKCGGRRVKRRVLSSDQAAAIISRLEEPYATLVLLLSVTGLRICEAIAVKWTDFDGDLLRVQRRIYDGEEDAVKSQKSRRALPIPRMVLERMRALGGGEWVFRSEAGTPVNPKNALNRYVRPVVKSLGIEIGGWHDFRHTLSTRLRRDGVHPKIVSGVLGHSKVDLAMNVYDHLEAEELREPLARIAERMVPDGAPQAASA